jgi:3-oxoadipate enol-lactonase
VTSIRASDGYSVTSTGLAYEQHGDGRTVVLLHGWALTGRLWADTAGRLGRSHRVVVPDLPGLGQSAAMCGPYTTGGHALAISELLDELDHHRVTLVGFAYGAVVAAKAALLSAARVDSLVLVGLPSAGHLPCDRMLASMQRDWPGYARRSAEALRSGEARSTAELAAMFAAARPEVAAQMWADICGFDTASLLRQLDCPVLGIHGANDRFAPPASARRALDACATAELRLLPDCGHLAMADQPAAFHSALLRHLAGRSRALERKLQ